MSARVIRIDPDAFERAALEPAARALEAGEVVAFPTETVYGLGCRADRPQALERLRALKGRDRDKPLTRHAPDPRSAVEPLRHVPPRVLPALRRFWPGPLTVVFPQPEGGGEGVRVPAHPVAEALLSMTRAPVAASSANLSGEPPASRVEDIPGSVTEKLSVIVDAGPSTLREASTVVRVADTTWSILREGIVSAAMLRPLLQTVVLFVCTGNSCRSPMAEALFRKRLADLLHLAPRDLARHGFHVLSAGVAAGHGAPASPQAVEVMRKRDLDLSGHRSQPVTRELIERASLIVAMSHSHVDTLLAWWPEIAERTMVIREEGVPDPIGGTPERYRAAAEAIEAGFERVLDRLFGDALGRLTLTKLGGQTP